MAEFNTAGLDPVFWLHHCNLDRLWDVWIDKWGVDRVPQRPRLAQDEFQALRQRRRTGRQADLRDRRSSDLGYVYESIEQPAGTPGPHPLDEMAAPSRPPRPAGTARRHDRHRLLAPDGGRRRPRRERARQRAGSPATSRSARAGYCASRTSRAAPRPRLCDLSQPARRRGRRRPSGAVRRQRARVRHPEARSGGPARRHRHHRRFEMTEVVSALVARCRPRVRPDEGDRAHRAGRGEGRGAGRRRRARPAASASMPAEPRPPPAAQAPLRPPRSARTGACSRCACRTGGWAPRRSSRGWR